MNSNTFAFATSVYVSLCFSRDTFIIPAWRVAKWLFVAVTATVFVLGVVARQWADNYVESRLQTTEEIYEDVWQGANAEDTMARATAMRNISDYFTQYDSPLESHKPQLLLPAAKPMGTLGDVLDYAGEYQQLISMTVRDLRKAHKVPSRYTKKSQIVKYIMEGVV